MDEKDIEQIFEFETDLCAIQEGQFSNDQLEGFGRSLDDKNFKIGMFNSESKMQGYGKKVSRNDNKVMEGSFMNDNIIDARLADPQDYFNISSYSQ